MADKPTPKKNPRSGGRKPKLDPELVAAAFAELQGNAAEVAKRFGVSKASVTSLLNKRKSANKIPDDTQNGHPTPPAGDPPAPGEPRDYALVLCANTRLVDRLRELGNRSDRVRGRVIWESCRPTLDSTREFLGDDWGTGSRAREVQWVVLVTDEIPVGEDRRRLTEYLSYLEPFSFPPRRTAGTTRLLISSTGVADLADQPPRWLRVEVPQGADLATALLDQLLATAPAAPPPAPPPHIPPPGNTTLLQQLRDTAAQVFDRWKEPGDSSQATTPLNRYLQALKARLLDAQPDPGPADVVTESTAAFAAIVAALAGRDPAFRDRLPRDFFVSLDRYVRAGEPGGSVTAPLPGAVVLALAAVVLDRVLRALASRIARGVVDLPQPLVTVRPCTPGEVVVEVRADPETVFPPAAGPAAPVPALGFDLKAVLTHFGWLTSPARPEFVQLSLKSVEPASHTNA